MKKIGSLVLGILMTFSVFGGIMPLQAENSSVAQMLLNEIIATKPIIVDDKLVLPKISNNDYVVELAGSSNEAVVDQAGNVYEPLETMEVRIMYRVVNKYDQNDFAFLPNNDVVLTVAGKYEHESKDNARPVVLPGIREWKGLEGDFPFTDNSKIVITDEFFKAAGENIAYYFKTMLGRDIPVVVQENADDGDIIIKSSNRGELGTEGNYIEITNRVIVEAKTVIGATYAGATLTQILSQGSLPKGYIRDYPAYALRAQMIDVARFYMSLDYLEEVTKYMAYFKINQLQVHINDDGGEQQASFRVESKKYPQINSGLKPEEVYRQDQYRQYQKNVSKFGVDVITEIDTPAHCRFVGLYDQSLMLDDSHIDLANPKAIEFIKSLYDEFLDGEDPVFISDNFHIGADEYKREAQYADDFLNYVDGMIKYINQKGLQPRMWASLGSGGIQWNKDIDNDVYANYWAYSWADFPKMLEKGYRCINTSTDLYVVPGTSTGYEDYLPLDKLYENWEANMLGGGTTISPAHPLLEGCQAAIWYDRQVGMSQFDYFDRIKDQLMLISEKGWFGTREKEQTSEDFNKRINAVANKAPGSNPARHIDSADETVINYDFEDTTDNIVKDKSGNGYDAIIKDLDVVEDRYQKALRLDGNGSLQLPFATMGFPYTLSMDLWIDENTLENAVLFSGEDGVLYLNYQGTGKIGYERKGYQYLLDYELDTGRWQNVMLTCDGYGLNLYIDEVFKASGSYLNDKNTKPESSTFVLPLEQIGTDVKGKLDNLIIKNTYSSFEQMTGMDSLDYRNLALNKPTEVSGLEVDGKNTGAEAVDGNTDTRVAFHRDNNAWFKVDLEDIYLIDKIDIDYNERPNKYEVYVSQNGTDWEKVYEDLKCEGKSKGLDTIDLTKPVEARYIKWQQLEMFSTYTGDQYSGNFLEFRVFGYAGITELNKLLTAAKDLIENTPITNENADFIKRFTKNTEMYETALAGDSMEEKCWMGQQLSKQIERLKANDVSILNIDISKPVELLEKEIDRDIFDKTTLKKYDDLCKEVRYALMDVEADQAKINAITSKLQICLEEMLENKIIVTANKDPWKTEYALEYMADGNKNSFGWVSSSQDIGDYFQFELRYPITLESVNIYNLEANDIIEGANIEVSMDGSSWTKVGVLSGIANERVEISSTKVKYIRFVITKAASHWTRIDEVIFNETKPVDTSKLEELLALQYNEEKYTPNSYLAYINAKTIAGEVLNASDKIQAKIDQAIIDLQKAIDELLERANTKELDALISEAKSKDVDGYTEVTVKEFKEALSAAQGIITNLNATQKQVDDVYNKLDKALVGLIPDKQALNLLIIEAKTYVKADYIEDTFNDLQAALDNAEIMYKNEQATLEQINEVYRALQEVINKLEKVVINKEKLVSLIGQCKLILDDQDNYISSTVDGLAALIGEAELLNANQSVTQKQVDEMAGRLQIAIDLAKLKADLSKLNEAILRIEDIDLNLYTQASRERMNKLLLEAKELIKRNNLTIDDQNLVDGTVRGLEHEITQLKYLADFTKLYELIGKVEKMDLNNYTTATVKTLQEALTKAKETVTNFNLSSDNQNDVDEIAKNLVKAVDGLRKTVEPESVPNPPNVSSKPEIPATAAATGDDLKLFSAEILAISVLGIIMMKKRRKE